LNVNSDDIVNLNESSVADLFEHASMSWKSYAEDYPENCFQDAIQYPYVRKHVPFLSFTNISSIPNRCNNVVNANKFKIDLVNGALPTFSFYTPNLINDGHDSTIVVADTWLRLTFDSMFSEAESHGILYIVTFDEDDLLHNNHVYTVFIGAGVRRGARSFQNYNHYNLLRTIEDIFKIGTLGRNDDTAIPIKDIWK